MVPWRPSGHARDTGQTRQPLSPALGGKGGRTAQSQVRVLVCSDLGGGTWGIGRGRCCWMARGETSSGDSRQRRWRHDIRRSRLVGRRRRPMRYTRFCLWVVRAWRPCAPIVSPSWPAPGLGDCAARGRPWWCHGPGRGGRRNPHRGSGAGASTRDGAGYEPTASQPAGPQADGMDASGRLKE
jgi:hypothetical protein